MNSSEIVKDRFTLLSNRYLLLRVEMSITEIIIHEKYEGKVTNWNYDIALLRTCGAIQFTNNIRPVS